MPTLSVLLGAVFFLLVACGCTDPQSGPSLGGSSVSLLEAASSPAPPKRDQQSILLDAVVYGPGADVLLSFPESSQRGGYFQLHAWTGSTWADAIYLLESDAGDGRRPSWVVIRDGVGTEDYDVSGPGPDRIQLPDSIDPGYWLLCAASSQVEQCVNVLIEE